MDPMGRNASEHRYIDRNGTSRGVALTQRDAQIVRELCRWGVLDTPQIYGLLNAGTFAQWSPYYTREANPFRRGGSHFEPSQRLRERVGKMARIDPEPLAKAQRGGIWRPTVAGARFAGLNSAWDTRLLAGGRPVDQHAADIATQLQSMGLTVVSGREARVRQTVTGAALAALEWAHPDRPNRLYRPHFAAITPAGRAVLALVTDNEYAPESDFRDAIDAFQAARKYSALWVLTPHRLAAERAQIALEKAVPIESNRRVRVRLLDTTYDASYLHFLRADGEQDAPLSADIE